MKRACICLVAVLAASCTPDEPARSWEEFLEQSTRLFNGNKYYVVEWDIALTLDELRGYYAEVVLQAPTKDSRWKATVNVTGKGKDIWTPKEAMNLTYCVSNEFEDKARVVAEMQTAAAAWEAETQVDFKYVPAADDKCTNNNKNITFAVRPKYDGAACAFIGPSGTGACEARTLLIDYDDIDWNDVYDDLAPNVTTVGVLRHELGHILGLRHEHIRPEAGGHCLEQQSSPSEWQDITPYDNNSVMHYPWCNGTISTTFDLTAMDKQGIRALYGPR